MLVTLSSVLTTLAVAVLMHVASVARTVRVHDAQAQDVDEDLDTWISDDRRAIEADVSAKIQQANAAGIAGGGFPAAMQRRLREHASVRYRDRLREAERTRRNLLLSEHVTHRLYRRWRQRPLPPLLAPQRNARTIRQWYEAATMGPQRIATDPATDLPRLEPMHTPALPTATSVMGQL